MFEDPWYSFLESLSKGAPQESKLSRISSCSSLDTLMIEDLEKFTESNSSNQMEQDRMNCANCIFEGEQVLLVDEIKLADAKEGTYTAFDPKIEHLRNDNKKVKEFNPIDHTYYDFSSVIDQSLTPRSLVYGQTLVSSLNGETISKENSIVVPPREDMKNIATFPIKLMDLLSITSATDAITWLPHGRAFLILNEKRLEQIMPMVFNSTKSKSFYRQLNLWGFKRISRGPDAGSYYHQLFLRGKPNLALRMPLVKIKGTGRRLACNVSGLKAIYLLIILCKIPHLYHNFIA